MKWDLSAERDIFRAVCAPGRWFDKKDKPSTHPKSLYWFVRLAYGVDFYLENHPEQPKWFSDHIHEPYTNWLQHHILAWKEACRRGSTDRYYIANIMPRGFGKTICATKCASIWAHLDEPDMSTLIASSTTPLAEDILNSMKAIISGLEKDSWFAWLYGDWKKGSKDWLKTHLRHGYRKFKNISEPSFDTTSVDTGMTGYHHRWHVWDDPIFVNKLRQGRQTYMRAVHTAVNASYNALQGNGFLMLTLTRYLDDDVAGRHLRDEGVASWSGMPCPSIAMFDKVPMGKGMWHVYFFQTEDELTGEPTHPILYDKKKIAEAKRRDPEDFACQQQNNPGSGERAPIVESQLQDIFMDYRDFLFTVPVDAASVHIDTAFKTNETIRTGDDSAIVTWLHDARRNGVIYLDTNLLVASNEWREPEFNDELIKILVNLRRRVIRVKAMTDEIEPGGKAGAYRGRIMSVIRQVGLNIPESNFKQLNRTRSKRARIRSALGYWTEGYVKILLNKNPAGEWIIPQVLRKFFQQITKVDVVEHDDIADAATDVFTPGIWVKPVPYEQQKVTENDPWQPWDENLKALSRPMTNEELYALIDENKETQKTMGPGHGWDDESLYDYEMPREPV